MNRRYMANMTYNIAAIQEIMSLTPVLPYYQNLGILGLTWRKVALELTLQTDPAITTHGKESNSIIKKNEKLFNM